MNVTKNSRSKLLAAVMVMAVVLAGAVVVLSDENVDAARTGIVVDSAGFDVSMEGTTYTFTKDAKADATTTGATIFDQGENLVSNWAYVTIDLSGVFSETVKEVAIKQTNTALKTAYGSSPGGNIDASAGTKSQTGYTLATMTDGGISGGFSFLVPSDGSDVKIEIYNSNVVSGDADLTYTFKFADTVIVSEVKDPADLTDAFTGATRVVVAKTMAVDTLEVPAGKTLEIAKGVTFTVNKSLTFEDATSVLAVSGTLAKGASGNITLNSANVAASYDAVLPEGITPTESIYAENSDILGYTGTLDQSETIESPRYLAGDVTIPQGVTLTVNSQLDLGTNNLIVNGNLVLGSKGFITSVVDDKGIQLGTTGTITNDGTIGKGNHAVTVSYNGQTVQTQNVSGISYGFNKVGVGIGAEYTLAISGDVKKASGTTNNDVKTVTINGAVINGAVTVSKDVTLAGTFSVVKGGSLVTVGPNSAAITLENGSSVTINGVFTGSITAQVKEGLTAQQANSYVFGNGDAAKLTLTKATDDDGNDVTVTGFTLEVKRTQYTADNGDVMFNQRVYLSGNIDVTEDKIDKIAAKVTGNVFIDKDVKVIVSEYAGLSTDNGLFIVNGTIQSTMDISELDYVGAYYSITPEGTTDTVYYIQNFDAAMQAIGTTDDGLTVSGTADFGIEISANITIADEQVIRANADASDFVTIKESATVTVENGGELDPAVIKDIEGKLVVMDGGDCTPDTEDYDVMSSNDAGDITYAGFQVIINNAQPGDEITVTGDAKVTSITIPNGVTVTVEGTLTVEKTLTVAEGGKLVVNGGLTVGTDDTTEANKDVPGKLTVNGEADFTNAESVTMVGGSTDNKAVIDSTGTTKYISSSFGTNVDINGATYMDADGNTVLTTVTKAVAGAVEAETLNVTVIGTVTDTTDVVLNGATLTIDGKATLGNIDVSESKLTVNDGKSLTATISGQYGDEGSTATASIELTGAIIKDVTNTSAVNSQNVNVWALTFASVNDGSVEIVQGTVVAGNMTGVETAGSNAADSLVVAQGATLSVTGDVDFTGYKTITIEGTLDIANGGELDVTTTEGQTFTVAGTMSVSGTATVDTMVLTGTLNITNDETTTGTMNVDASISIGEASKTLGATGTVNGLVKLGGTAYALAYPGTTVAASNFGNESSVNSTQFYINGALYVTAYATGTVAAIGTDGFMAGVEIVGYKTEEINTVGSWCTDEAMENPLKGDSFTVGAEDAVYTELTPATAYVQYSAGSQISLYVDGVKVTSGTIIDLSVGTHQVTATVNPGYTGEVTITFNGQTITGGSFEITPEMNKTATEKNPVVLSATGNISVDTGSTGSSDDGMGLTEILLVILVILIVVMAIMVALRLMRS